VGACPAGAAGRRRRGPSHSKLAMIDKMSLFCRSRGSIGDHLPGSGGWVRRGRGLPGPVSGMADRLPSKTSKRPASLKPPRPHQQEHPRPAQTLRPCRHNPGSPGHGHADRCGSVRNQQQRGFQGRRVRQVNCRAPRVAAHPDQAQEPWPERRPRAAFGSLKHEHFFAAPVRSRLACGGRSRSPATPLCTPSTRIKPKILCQKLDARHYLESDLTRR